MPPLVLHMAFARQVQETVRASVLAEQVGPFLLGATTPDIRVLTRWQRQRTHFFDFDDFDHQDSVARFFAENPDLSDPGRLNESTAAFVAGYTTHLALDEGWICEIFRAFFGKESSLGGDAEAQVLDRLLQYELDRRRREDKALMKAIREALAGAEAGVDCGFIEAATLQRWRELAAEQTTYPGDYERLRYYSGRQLRALGVDVEDASKFDQFLLNVPDLLAAALRHVSAERVDEFIERAQAKASRAVARYLECE